MNTTEKIRLNKYIAMCGIASRRKADDLIKEGKVSINGDLCTKFGTLINPEEDTIKVDNITLGGPMKSVYYMVNKPRGYICANSSEFSTKLAINLVPNKHVFTVGRLDAPTSGLLLLTNDGALKNRITQPSYFCEKEYLIKVIGFITDETVEKLRKGIDIEIENSRKQKLLHFAKPVQISILKRSKNRSVLSMTLTEGKKRQIRLMMKAVGYPKIDLKRIRIGNLPLDDLESGQFKELTKEEIKTYFP